MRKHFTIRRLYNQRKNLEHPLSVIFAIALVYLGIATLPSFLPFIIVGR